MCFYNLHTTTNSRDSKNKAYLAPSSEVQSKLHSRMICRTVWLLVFDGSVSIAACAYLFGIICTGVHLSASQQHIDCPQLVLSFFSAISSPPPYLPNLKIIKIRQPVNYWTIIIISLIRSQAIHWYSSLFNRCRASVYFPSKWILKWTRICIWIIGTIKVEPVCRIRFFDLVFHAYFRLSSVQFCMIDSYKM